jgi:transcriptional regulator with XRE-family HTH domain
MQFYTERLQLGEQAERRKILIAEKEERRPWKGDDSDKQQTPCQEPTTNLDAKVRTSADGVKNRQPARITWYPELAAELARREITHAAIADAVGCTSGTISQIIRGRTVPDPELRRNIAEFLGIDIGALFVENPTLAHIDDSRIAQGLPKTITDRSVLRRKRFRQALLSAAAGTPWRETSPNHRIRESC